MKSGVERSRTWGVSSGSSLSLRSGLRYVSTAGRLAIPHQQVSVMECTAHVEVVTVADEVDPLDGLARSLADHVLRAAGTGGGPTLAELCNGSTAALMALIRDYAGHEVDADMVAKLGERVYGPSEMKAQAVLAAIEAEVRHLYAIAWSADLMAKNFEHATGGYGPGDLQIIASLTPRALYEAVKVWRSARDA